MLRLHDPVEALRRIEETLSTIPPDTSQEKRRWLLLLAAAARDAGHPDRVEPWIGKLEPEKDDAESARRRIRSAAADPSFAAARAEALRIAAAGRPEEALDRLETLRVRDPRQAAVRYDIGRLLQQMGRFEEARGHLEYAALSAGPELSGWAWIRLGWEMDRAGRRDDAVALYEHAARMKSFTFQPAARLRLERPSTQPPDA